MFLKRFQPTSLYLSRRSRLVDRGFQYRYTLIVLSCATLGTAAALLPIYYFTNQNYQIFLQLASDQAPSLINSLEREQTWLQIILSTTLLGTTVFFFVLGFKITNRIMGPLKVLKNHLKQTCRGNFKQAPIKVRDNDEFQDLIETYNYFYHSCQLALKRDLELLRKIKVDPKNRDAHHAWVMLIEEKTQQIETSPSTFLKSVESLDSRRVS